MFGWRASTARYLRLRAGQIAAAAQHISEHRLGAGHVAAARNDRAKLTLRRVQLAALDRRPRRCVVLAHAGARQRLFPPRLVLGIGGNGARQKSPRFGGVSLAQPHQSHTTKCIGILRVLRQGRLEGRFRLPNLATVQRCEPCAPCGSGLVCRRAARVARLLQQRTDPAVGRMSGQPALIGRNAGSIDRQPLQCLPPRLAGRRGNLRALRQRGQPPDAFGARRLLVGEELRVGQLGAQVVWIGRHHTGQPGLRGFAAALRSGKRLKILDRQAGGRLAAAEQTLIARGRLRVVSLLRQPTRLGQSGRIDASQPDRLFRRGDARIAVGVPGAEAPGWAVGACA